jgi:hypothetical protein
MCTCQNLCIECQWICQSECQNKSQKICQKECQTLPEYIPEKVSVGRDRSKKRFSSAHLVISWYLRSAVCLKARKPVRPQPLLLGSATRTPNGLSLATEIGGAARPCAHSLDNWLGQNHRCWQVIMAHFWDECYNRVVACGLKFKVFAFPSSNWDDDTHWHWLLYVSMGLKSPASGWFNVNCC